MVNYQTSQYEHMNLFFYCSSSGVFQYVRDILKVTVSLDHPVAPNCPCHPWVGPNFLANCQGTLL